MAKKKSGSRKKSAAQASPRKKTAKKTARTSRKKALKKDSNGTKADFTPGFGEIAREMAKQQREISVSEFFTKNRHLLGFDNPARALLTTIKEAVDNSLDACEEAGILPELVVEIEQLAEERFRVTVEDNGPGIVKRQIPMIFGKLLYGSKFHRLKMSRGQQGIGISAAGMYGQLTTGVSIKITSRISPKTAAHRYELHINTQKNEPEILKDEQIEWKKKHGTKIVIELEARYTKGRRYIDEYLEQTVIANPHVSIAYKRHDGQLLEFARASKTLPVAAKEIRPHPYGVEIGMLMAMLRDTKARTLQKFLTSDFSRVSPRIAKQICEAAGVKPNARPSRIAKQEAANLYDAINATKIMAPPTDCLSPIGETLILKGLKNQVAADFYAASSRRPSVYRGNPFLVEAGIAFGGDLPEESLAKLLRFANKVPLLYQQGACVMTDAVINTSWRNYNVSQSRGALPAGPLLVMVHIASVWVPFTSESKEAVAHYPEIEKEIRLCLQDCGRRLGAFVNRRRREAESLRKKSYIHNYIPHIGIALREILKLSERKEKAINRNLKDILERSRS